MIAKTIPGTNIAQLRREICEVVATAIALALVASSSAALAQMLEERPRPLSDEEFSRIFAKNFRLPTACDQAIMPRCALRNPGGGQSVHLLNSGPN